MPINQTVKGDLLDLFDNNEFNAIAHGCNCFHKMGGGIAAQIKKRYFHAYRVDCNYTTKGDPGKLGSYTKAVLENKVIYNLYTQYHHDPSQNPVSYEAIGKCFMRLNDEFGNWNPQLVNPHLGIPEIGAGLAGGKWDLIKYIINEVTPNLNITLVQWDKK